MFSSFPVKFLSRVFRPNVVQTSDGCAYSTCSFGNLGPYRYTRYMERVIPSTTLQATQPRLEAVGYRTCTGSRTNCVRKTVADKAYVTRFYSYRKDVYISKLPAALRPSPHGKVLLSMDENNKYLTTFLPHDQSLKNATVPGTFGTRCIYT